MSQRKLALAYYVNDGGDDTRKPKKYKIKNALAQTKIFIFKTPHKEFDSKGEIMETG